LKKTFQKSVLFIYKVASSTGILETSIGKAVSGASYSLYKKIFESSITHLSKFVPENSYILDIGANVGFYTLQFTSWVSGSGRVIAIEPEVNNLLSLKKSLENKHINNVDLIQAAAVDFDGKINLAINPDNPADHRISEVGITVDAITIDTLMKLRGCPFISFIKIDVQGAEYRALLGAEKTLLASHPVILMEIDDPSLEAAGTSSDILIAYLKSLGYEMFSAEKKSGGYPITKDIARAMRSNVGYADFVFIHPKSKRAY
jgi:FkbM family methyltransferase